MAVIRCRNIQAAEEASKGKAPDGQKILWCWNVLLALIWSGQRLPVIQFVKIVFQNEIVKESLINLLMSDQKTPETSLVLQWALLLDVALADFKVSRFGDSHDALNDTENLRVRQPRFQDESVSFPKTVRPVNDIATSAAVQDSGRTIGNYTVIWSKATSYTICKNCISERDSQRKPDKCSYVGPEDARNKPRTAMSSAARCCIGGL